MQKMKKYYYSLAAALMLAPVAVSAQFSTPGGTGLEEGTTIADIIQNIMQWLLYVIGFIAIIGFVIAGILYITAAGDEGQIEKAKKAMIYSIIGVLVALFGLIIIGAIQNLLGGGDRF